MQSRLQEIEELIAKIAAGDARGPATAGGDEFDAIIKGINGLAEQLARSQAALKAAEEKLERRQAEMQTALDKSQERWFLALEGSGDGLWDWDVLSNEVYYSPRWEEMFGYERESAPRNFESFSRLVHPEDLPGLDSRLKAYFAGEFPIYSNEFRMFHTNGRPMWTLHRGAAIFDSAGNPVRMIGTTADITDRKKAETEVTRIHDMLLRTNSVARVGGWELDLVRQELSWTDVTREIHDCPPEYKPDLATAIEFYKDGPSREAITASVERAIQDGTAYDLELLLVTAKNREVWVRAIGEAEFQNGTCVRLYGTFQDIDSRKKAEEELIKTREQAVVANKAKTEFLAHMSHELRTPLNAVLGFTQILRSGSEKDERDAGLETIQNSGEHLLTLIEDLLDMAKIEAGHLELKEHDFSLDTLLRNVSTMMELRATEKDLDFVFTLPENLPDLVRGDSRKLRQVLLNLLSNAIKFTAAGRVEFQIEPVENKWKISVTDTGIGIDAEDIRNLFKPFQRLENEQIITQGSGLGLAISQKIVQSMGGQIQVASQVGQGSTFWFEIAMAPARASSPQERRRMTRPTGYQGDRKKIMIVDDDLDNRRLLNVFLSPLGFELLEAVNGRDCLQKIEAWRPDLILLDLMMPVLDGFATCEAIRKNEKDRDIRIIALSADAYPQTQEKIKSVGSDNFLSKPVKFSDLVGMLGDYLDLEWVFPADSPDPGGSS